MEMVVISHDSVYGLQMTSQLVTVQKGANHWKHCNYQWKWL
jgi:hypothetical protein